MSCPSFLFYTFIFALLTLILCSAEIGAAWDGMESELLDVDDDDDGQLE